MQFNDEACISVVVPVLNGAEVVSAALESLTDQDGVALQIIVVDGGSTDGTLDRIAAFGDLVDAVVSEPDFCQADALNKGFALAEGDYFAWLCADDRLLPGALQTLAEALKKESDAALVTGGCLRRYTYGDEVIRPSPDFDTRLTWMNTIEQPSSLWRAHMHRRAGTLDLSLRYAFDWEFWLRLREQGHFIAIDEIVSEYVFSGTNLTALGGDALAEDMYMVLKRHGPANGRLADAYRFLYRVFDKRGFYDAQSAHPPPRWARAMHHLVLGVMHRIYGRELIDSYNWNFASRQARGLDVF